MTDLFADRYRIVKELGRGSFGVVYLAHDTRLYDKPVALKVLHPALNADPSTVQLFQREASILAALEHDHIVPIYDVGLDQGTRFLVMKYVAGRSLAEILKVEGRQPPERVLGWFDGIAAGLDYAHGQGVLHRDLKPGNLLLDESRQRVVITDFGLARAVQQSGGSSVSQSQENITGTAYYMAPEVIKGGKQSDASDLYSLGCVLYEALQGERPFQGENFVAISFQHVHEPPPPLDLTGDLGELLSGQVTALLAKDPAARPPSATAAVEAVHQGVRDREAARAAAAAAALAAATAPVLAPAASDAAAVPPAPPAPPEVIPAGPAGAQPPGDAQPPAGPPTAGPSIPWRSVIGVALLTLALIVLAARNGWRQFDLADATATAPPTAAAVAGGPTGGAPPTTTPHPANTATPETSSAAAPAAVPSSEAAPRPAFTPTPPPTGTATSMPTATPTPPPTATGTSAPAPTPTPAATTPPTRSPILPAKATATRQLPATATPTSRAVSPTPATLPAPELAGPEPGFNTTGPVPFAWRWAGPPLSADQGFEIRVWKDGQPDHYGAADPVSGASANINVGGAYGVQQGGPGEYWWTVAVVQRAPNYQRIGAEAPPRRLIVSGGGGGGGGAPTRTPRPPPS